ncbi:thioredoxin domain-containing protein [Staphylococcus haemolyticus]|uniref:thioredoxin domain-containing protein n=1 Tax=Staphylococcus haemolyticus TaxID=1283 RepID=UPI0028FEA37C|nr:thioredoxin domain-containing protein [Staphylococcus haemolyticus]MDU0439610.1 thioredoxin domain-containing protein [Staphylococcus haemolyticus]MDU0443630.1 thioredoxin domain-containing protein [Staphylococcus haemolyticus]MDU0448835.1 thioredoxin domain-containing protein [Staphylococcus haemolyticus]MDU0485657.1 thioredoxin domain-containing protein [Staphylococcus haemolyticus]MDU0490329.1 thioredoxin domain-containing protein [Staphylococcus haemolyticus]
MKKIILIISMLMVLTIIMSACSNNNNEKQPPKTKNGKILIVEYGDFKCPYCKKVEKNVMPTIKKDYIDTNKVEYQFINAGFLGKDSIVGSRAGNAVQKVAPNEYLTFQRNVLSNQKDEDKKWLTEQFLDNEIDKLDITTQQKSDIKKQYKTKNSDAWKKAEEQKKMTEDNNIDTIPTVFINGKKVKDPYEVEEWKKYL